MFGVKTVLGLPVHVLVVHFAVVLVPIAAIALIIMVWRGEWRRSYSLPVAVLAVIGAVAAFLAAQSGGSLRRSLRETARAAGTRADFHGHPGYGNQAEVAAVLLAVAAIGIWAYERWGERLPLGRWANAGYAMSCVLGVLAIGTMVLAGHTGASLVWKDLGNFVAAK